MSKVGYSSNHGMSTCDAKQELLKQEGELLKKNKGHIVSCPYCSENFHFSKKEYSEGDAIRLSDLLQANKCPWCNEGWKKLMAACQHTSQQQPVVEHTFTLKNGSQIKVVRKPEGWRGARKAIKAEEIK